MLETLLPTSDDPIGLLTAASFHLAVVRDVKDPDSRGRVRVECPSLYGSGKENWTDWCERVSLPIGGIKNAGDHGVWWPAQVGESCMLGFLAGFHETPFVMAGPPWSNDDDPYIPSEVKAVQDGRTETRIREIKSEAGHSWFIDDNGKSECMFLCDWTGAGDFWICPGKTEDDDEQQCDKSKERKGTTRGSKTAFAGNAPKPSEAVEGGVALTGKLDLNGQGLIQVATDDAGQVLLYASPEAGEVGPCIQLDAAENRIVLAAGDTQLHIDGKSGHIDATRMIILEAQPISIVEAIKKVYQAIQGTFQKYTG